MNNLLVSMTGKARIEIFRQISTAFSPEDLGHNRKINSNLVFPFFDQQPKALLLKINIQSKNKNI